MWYPGNILVNGRPLGSAGGGSGGGSVAWGDITGKPTRLGAFTASDETKLDGIQALAAVNPPHIVMAAFEDSDTDLGVQDGVIGLYESDNSLWQGGDPSDIANIQIAFRGATFGQDATNPGTDLTAVSRHQALFDDLIANGGTPFLTISRHGDSHQIYVLCRTITKETDHYNLTHPIWIETKNYGSGSGYSWNFIMSLDAPHTVKEIVDLDTTLAAYVLKTALEGHENDQFATYDNALFGSTYFPGNFCLFTGTTQPTDDTNAIGAPDITSGSGVIVLGDPRDDSDPDKAFTPETLNASDWPSGRVIHISPWHPYDPSAYLTVTLTSAGVKVGSGNAEHIWAQASWVEHGNIKSTLGSDYFRLSENTPSQLKFDLPLEAMPALPSNYVRLDGSNVTQALKDKIQGDNESVKLTPDFRVNATNVDYYVSWTESNKTLQIRLPSNQANTQTDTDLKRLLHPASWLRLGQWIGAVTTNATRAIIGTSLTFTFNYQTLSGTIPTGNDTYKIIVVGEDVHRGELRDGAFREEAMNLLGDAEQQAFDSNSWTSYSGVEFSDNDLIGLCLSPTENGYGDFLCIRFGDVGTTGGQIHTSGFSGRRNGSDYQIQRTSGSATLYVRIFVIGNNSN